MPVGPDVLRVWVKITLWAGKETDYAAANDGRWTGALQRDCDERWGSLEPPKHPEWAERRKQEMGEKDNTVIQGWAPSHLAFNHFPNWQLHKTTDCME